MTDLDPNRRLHRWAEVDVRAIERNTAAVLSRLPESTRLIAVVKANGYGHGGLAAARAALAGGAWGLAVATLEEAVGLEDASVADRILILGGLLPEDAPELVRKGFAVTCSNRALFDALRCAADPNHPLPVHLKVDTGMSRLGCAMEDAPELARDVVSTPGLRLAGTYTHFASQESDEELTREQYARFLDVLSRFEVDPGMRHACASLGALRHPDMALDAVRAGIAIYGCEDEVLEPAMNLRCLITHVKTVREGWTVGYGATWRAEKPTRVATAALGYADGVFRARSGRGFGLIKGRRAPLIGRVSMDLVTFDVSGIDDVTIGDVVTVIGRDGDEVIRPELVAEWSDTISYEVLTSIGTRVVRRYME